MREFVGLAAETLGQYLDVDRVLVVGNSQRKRSVYLYGLSGRDPVVVARMPGNHDVEKRCRAEHEVFRTFAGYGVADVLTPKAIGEFKYQDHDVFFQEVVVSKQWQGRIPNRGKLPRKIDFHRATDYLTTIFQSTRQVDDAGNVHCFQHGDFWMGNLGQKGSSLVLYDLEYGKADGDPLYDLFHFCLYYRVALRNRGLVGTEVAEGTYKRGEEKRTFSITKEDVHTVFIDTGPFRDVVAFCIKRYCGACMISTETAAESLKGFVENRIENNTGIQGFPSGWERAVTGNK
jgi:hypothetical protein